MAGLSNIFGGDDSSSSSSGGALGSDTVGDLGNTVGLNIDNSNSQSSTDEDGNSQSSDSAQSLSLDSDTDGLLGSVTDAVGMTDESSN